jgi:serine/threonine protein kinase/Flp pilus assembly protein TadD
MGQQTQTVREDLTGATVGRYLVIRRLGAGGMGEVYLAEDSKLKRTVALKRMGARLRSDERYRQRFLKEAERASRLMHPQIAALYDILEIDGEMFLVIEYVNGHTLRKAIRDPLDFESFLRVAIQCADALEAAHTSGVVHRDIKPENIMLTQSGSIKILDFGLAKELPSAAAPESVENIATTGALSGTPAYMAPEVLMELRPDGRADIFSLGVVLYEVLTGQHPFLANSFVETTDRIIRQTPPAIRELNPKVAEEIEQAVMRMLAKDPAERYESAAQLANQLRVLQKQLQFEPSPELPGRLARISGFVIPPARSKWQMLPLAGLLLLMIIAVAFLTWRLYQQSIQARLTAIPDKRHLAVLPFGVIGNDAANTAFSNGLSETLTVKLTQLTDKYPLEVVPLSELRAEKVSTAEQARKAFSVNLVLEGQMQTFGNQVRINYSLVDPLSRRQLRADTITADYSNPFSVEDRVVDSVLAKLDLELQKQERDAMRNRGTNNAEAYELYLRGRGYLQEYEKPENIESAIHDLNTAIENDRKYANAYAALGDAYFKKYNLSHEPSWVERARTACTESAHLAEKQGYSHGCLGKVYNGTGKYEQAVQQFQTAVSLDPTNDDFYRGLASSYQQLNDFDNAEKTFLNAIELRPNYWANYKWLAYFYMSRGRYEDAAAMYKKLIDVAPDSFRGYQNLGGIYVYLGRYDDAIPILQRSVSIRPNSGAYSNLATAHFYLKRYSDAIESYQKALELDPRNYVLWMNLGDAYSRDSVTKLQAESAYRKSVELCAEVLKVNPRDVNPLRVMAMSEAMLNERRQAIDAIERAIQIAPKNPLVLYYAALVHAQFREHKLTLEWLRKSLDAGTTVAQVKDSPLFDFLSQKSEFQALLRKHQVQYK